VEGEKEVDMSQLTEKDKAALLALARSVIAERVGAGESVAPPEGETPPLKELRGCFVSLHKKNRLRGCIGTIEPVAPLTAGVRENALNAAFEDPRFPPLNAAELDDVEVEISVLTSPQPLEFSDPQQLLSQLRPGVHGVILTKSGRRSTFLPQVWKQLPDKKRFLEHLCLKAGMTRDCWKEEDITVQVYEVESFSEAPDGSRRGPS
jgi:AmmeMemoRadiSam system protein A